MDIKKLKCIRCNIEKDLSEFHKKYNDKFGINRRCKF